MTLAEAVAIIDDVHTIVDKFNDGLTSTERAVLIVKGLADEGYELTKHPKRADS